MLEPMRDARVLRCIGAAVCSAAVLGGQVCRLQVAGLNQSRRVIGPVNVECPGEVVHSAPFGNWGVTSNYGQKRDSRQFDGWCHDTPTCDNAGNCRTSCTGGWYEWNSCTDHSSFRAPNCSLFNTPDCAGQVTATGANVHGTKYVDVPVRCPLPVAGGPDAGGCSDVSSYASGVNFMSLYELDPATPDDLIQTLYFPETVVKLTCDAWGCAPAGSAWVAPTGYDSPSNDARVYAELATVVGWGAFVDPGGACSVSRSRVAYVSAASHFGPALAPGSIATGYGPGIAPVTAWAESLPLPANLGGAALVITDSSRRTHAAPLFYVSPSQVNFLVPAGVISGPATIAVYRGDVQVLVGDAQIEAVAPALFSAAANGQGVAAAYAVNIAGDGATTAQAVFSCAPDAGPCTYEPIDAGLGARSVLTLFGTGIRNAPDITLVSVTIGGEEARVLYAGPQYQFAGLDQVNVEVPSQLTGRGEAEVVLTVAGRPSNKVTVFFQ
ncbi:MAG TPA: hypothetical protein VN428_05895 [Bryobacteraceae bacterium]|nr:hypothetical protein [Bryobacteraceae bacterium]